MSELLPCPFCGSSDVRDDYCIEIRCHNCGAIGPEDQFESFGERAKKWNARCEPLWKAEPTEEGLYWICDLADECRGEWMATVQRDDKGWFYTEAGCILEHDYEDSMRCCGPLKPPKKPEV